MSFLVTHKWSAPRSLVKGTSSLHKSEDLDPLCAPACTYSKPAQSDPAAISADKTLIINKCAGIQSYAVIWNTGYKTRDILIDNINNYCFILFELNLELKWILTKYYNFAYELQLE